MHMGGHEYQLQVPVGQSPQQLPHSQLVQARHASFVHAQAAHAQTTQQYTQDSRNLMPNGDSAAEAIGASTHKQLGAAAAASP
jgi:hypothetical protein